MKSDGDYMDEILLRKGFKELDDDLRVGVVKEFWEKLKTALQLEVEQWNQKCIPYDAASMKITFYQNPFKTWGMKVLAEGLLPESSRESSSPEQIGDLLDVPKWSADWVRLRSYREQRLCRKTERAALSMADTIGTVSDPAQRPWLGSQDLLGGSATGRGGRLDFRRLRERTRFHQGHCSKFARSRNESCLSDEKVAKPTKLTIGFDDILSSGCHRY